MFRGTSTSAIDSRAQWRDLLGRADDRHLETLAAVEHAAASLADASLIVPLAEPLALLVAKHGPAIAQRTCEAHRALLEAAAEDLGAMYQETEARIALALISLGVIAEISGAQLDCSALDTGTWLGELVWHDQLRDDERTLLALLALATRHTQQAESMLGVLGAPREPERPSDELAAWIAWLACAVRSPAARADLADGWTVFVRAFPGWLERGAARWQHLLVAARIVLGGPEGVAVAEVATSLHHALRELGTPG